MNDRQVEALAGCPFCGSMKIDPEGWTSLEQYKGTEQWRSGPSCEECGASAETVEKWNTRSRTPSAPDVAIREAAQEAMRLTDCPRPANGDPSDISAIDCHKLGHCGCAYGPLCAALSASEAKAGEPEGWTGKKCPHCKGTGENLSNPMNAGSCDQCGGTGDEYHHVAPTPPQVDREAVARIIEPHAFKMWHGQYHHCIKNGDDEDFAKRCADSSYKAECDEALTKADAILSLLAPTAPAQGEIR